MILDLEGAGPGEKIPPHHGGLLALASMAVAAAVLLMVAALPHQVPVRTVGGGPSIIAQSLQRESPKPRLSMVLPTDIATPLSQIGTQDGTGNARSVITPRSFRLRASNDVVSVAPIPDAPPVLRPTQPTEEMLAVHGNYAEWWTTEPSSVSVLRWTEDGTTYEISSRTLLPRELARIADLLR